MTWGWEPMTLRSENSFEQKAAVLFVVLGVALRLLPHPENFTPVTAIALFSGVTLSPLLAVTIPLIIMIASDLLIGAHSLYWLTWGSFLAVTLLGLWIRRSAVPSRILFGTLAGSVFFFVATNLGVFFFEGMYPKTWAGLVECFTMAVPFFRNSLLGDLFYASVLFSAFAGVKVFSKKFALR